MQHLALMCLVVGALALPGCDVPEEGPLPTVSGGAQGEAGAGGRSPGGTAAPDGASGGSAEADSGREAQGAGGYVGFSACEGETRAPTFRPGLEVEGASITVRVVSARPLQPIVGTNQWVLHVDDTNGVAVTGASVTVTPFMPDHGHGSPVRTVVSELRGGDYRASELFFSMPGYWQTRVQVTRTVDAGESADAGAATDAGAPIDEEVIVRVCVELPGP